MAIETEADFISLVKQAEQEAEVDPQRYNIKLALFAVLGYVVIFAVLLFLVGLVGGMLGIALVSTSLFIVLLKSKLIFGVLFAIWIFLRALWVRFDPPQGVVLERRDYPRLFSEIDALTQRLDALKIHKVILDNSMNAAVVQHPRLGVLGWHENILILGVQLLLALSTKEMISVLAHEFGHLSGNHSRFAGWIYRVRLTWNRVMEVFEQTQSWGAKLMRMFFDWYTPRFAAYSFALARSNEYEADAIAAELTSPAIASVALVNVHATLPYLEDKYWKEFFEQADQYPKPPHAPFDGLAQFIVKHPLKREEMLERIKEEMTVETHYADTQPSLKDRVDALGALPQLPKSPNINAARAWLGPHYDTIMDSFDQQWFDENQEAWNERFKYVTNAKSKLEEMRKLEVADLDDKALWDYAYWSNEFVSSEVALPLFKAYLERRPQDPEAGYFVGLILLEQKDPGGMEFLSFAREHPNLIEQAAHIGFQFLREQGRESEAEQWWQESLERNERHARVLHERNNLDPEKDTFVSPSVSGAMLSELKVGLGGHSKVGKVWLAEKVLEDDPGPPVYIVAFTPKGWVLSPEKAQQEVAEALQIEADIFVVCKAGEGKALAKKVIENGLRLI